MTEPDRPARRGPRGWFDAARSFPPGATPPTVPWAEPPTFTHSPAETPTVEVPDSGWTWPGRRTLRSGERVWVAVIAVLLAGCLGLLVAAADWAAHPGLASIATAYGLAAVAVVALSAKMQRPDGGIATGWRMSRLPRATRRASLRRLRSSDPGPPQLRSWAAWWTCRTLQLPWLPAFYLIMASFNAAGAATTPEPVGVLRVVSLIGFFLLVAAGVATSWGHRSAAHRAADALEQLTPPTPHHPITT